MPELPDVEVFRHDFERYARAKTVESVSCRDPLVVGTLGHRTLNRVLPGRRFGSTQRHGKYLFAQAVARDPSSSSRSVWLVIHFGMTGSLVRMRPGQPAPAYTRVVLRFVDGDALGFVDPRRFGRVGWVSQPYDVIETKKLGPDPLSYDFGVAGLRRALAGRRGAIKALLLDQSAIAGVGNLYADETLFQAGIHPSAPAQRLKAKDWEDLGRALDRVLRTAIARQAETERSPRSWLLSRRREDEPCPRCGAPLARTVVAGRTTYFCPRHQRRGRPGT